MATTSFPTRKDFYVQIGDNNEGITFEVAGGVSDNFTNYTMTLGVRCPNTDGFSMVTTVGVNPVNTAFATFVLTSAEMVDLGEGASNFYTATLKNVAGTWQKVCFDGAIVGRR